MERLVPYKLDISNNFIKPWLKRVDSVVPEKGNGWDIKGPFIPWQGALPEGTCLCYGYGVAQQGRNYPVSEWWAFRVCAGAGSNNLEKLRGPGPISVDLMQQALKEFPELAPVAMKPMSGVQYVLLRALREREEAEKRALEPERKPIRRIEL